MGEPLECKSRDGITVGLIDSIISIANVLEERLAKEIRRMKRDEDGPWFSPEVQSALDDLRHNKTLTNLLYPRDETYIAVLEQAAKVLSKKKPRNVEGRKP